MAFTNGTLLASGGDVYTQLMVILKAFMETAGWTTNEYDDYGFKYSGDVYTGKKLHSSKTIGSYTRYINIRSISNQVVFNGQFATAFSGIAAQGSTGYTGATQWDLMPGSTKDNPINSDAQTQGCGAVDIPTDNLSYWLFSKNSDNNIYLICQGTDGYTGIVFGATSTGNYFVSGGSQQDSGGDLSFVGHGVLCKDLGTFSSKGTMALRSIDNTSWFEWPTTTSSGAVAIPSLDGTNNINDTESLIGELLFCSPDNFKGNNPLIDSYISNKSSTGFVSNGIVPGIKFVNMKFVISLTELTFSADTYILFRLYSVDDANDSTIGLAILK